MYSQYIELYKTLGYMDANMLGYIYLWDIAQNY